MPNIHTHMYVLFVGSSFLLLLFAMCSRALLFCSRSKFYLCLLRILFAHTQFEWHYIHIYIFWLIPRCGLFALSFRLLLPQLLRLLLLLLLFIVVVVVAVAFKLVFAFRLRFLGRLSWGGGHGRNGGVKVSVTMRRVSSS